LALAWQANVNFLTDEELEDFLDSWAVDPDEPHFLRQVLEVILGASKLERRGSAQCNHNLTDIGDTPEAFDDAGKCGALQFGIEAGQYQGNGIALSVLSQLLLELIEVRLSQAMER
jgi:hypothetical protein